SSRIAGLVAQEPVLVRKPEKATRPKVFYVEGDPDALVPSAAPPPSDYMWSSGTSVAVWGPRNPPEADGAPRRRYGAREQHRQSWGLKVSAYLWTKSLAAG